MGTEKRVEPGMENKLSASIPGPTKYQLPSLVRTRKKLLNICVTVDLRRTKNFDEPSH